jgi:hypothetical protein
MYVSNSQFTNIQLAMILNKIFFFFYFGFIVAHYIDGDLYLSVDGNDDNSCLTAAPCASLGRIYTAIGSGQIALTVHIGSGTFSSSIKNFSDSFLFFCFFFCLYFVQVKILLLLEHQILIQDIPLLKLDNIYTESTRHL